MFSITQKKVFAPYLSFVSEVSHYAWAITVTPDRTNLVGHSTGSKQMETLVGCERELCVWGRGRHSPAWSSWALPAVSLPCGPGQWSSQSPNMAMATEPRNPGFIGKARKASNSREAHGNCLGFESSNIMIWTMHNARSALFSPTPYPIDNTRLWGSGLSGRKEDCNPLDHSRRGHYPTPPCPKGKAAAQTPEAEIIDVATKPQPGTYR